MRRYLVKQTRISIADEQDIPALCELLGILFAQEAEFETDPIMQRRGLQTIIANPNLGLILAAHLEGQPVGMVNLLFSVSTALGGQVAWLEDMVVHPEWRRYGVGSKLLQAAMAHCRNGGYKRITLLTDGDNLNAQRFYQKHGFIGSAMQPMRYMP